MASHLVAAKWFALSVPAPPTAESCNADGCRDVNKKLGILSADPTSASALAFECKLLWLCLHFT